MSDLAASVVAWSTAFLNEVATINFGTRVTKKADAGTVYPVYGGGGATFALDEFNREDCYIVSRFGMSKECVRFVAGKFFLNDSGLTVTAKNTNQLYQRFLDIYLLNKQSDIYGMGRGAAQKNLNVNAFRDMAIHLPPLDEQKRIVAVLDQAFAALDRARAHAEANLVDAKLLKERAADHLLNRIAASAPKRLLGKLAEFRNGLNFSRHSNGETVKVVGVGDFQRNFRLQIENLKTISIEGRLSDSDRLRAGDILTVRSNGNKDLIGRVMLVGEIEEDLSFSGFVIRIRVQSVDINPEYLCHVMKSKNAVAHLLAGGGGANISNLNQGILSSLEVAIPSAAKQREFVDLMNNLNAEIRLLVERAEAKISDLANLRQSLLQSAFSGQLT